MSEFPVVVYILFLIVLVPLLDLVTLLVAGGTQYLATNDFAAKAATQADYTKALTSMAEEAIKFQSNGLASFVHLQPVAGYTGCGDDLYVLATNILAGTVTSSPPNQPLSQAVNTEASMYEIQVKSAYKVSPLISLAALPVLGNVPGLGTPVTLTFTANRPVEHPGGLQAASDDNDKDMVTVTQFPRVGNNPGAPAQPTNTTWRNPNIYQQIQKAGQSIVSENVFMVQADNPNWTPAGVNVLPGQKIWVDTQAIGIWSPSGTVFQYDANGGPTSEWSPYSFNSPLQVMNLPMAALVGKVGSGSAFMVGNEQYNYPCSGSGMFSMIFNTYLNAYGQSTGAQQVRVIVVQ